MLNWEAEVAVLVEMELQALIMAEVVRKEQRKGCIIITCEAKAD